MQKRCKFGTKKKGEFLRLLAEGSRRGAAATACGISRETARRHIRDDTDFAAAVDDAETQSNEIIENALFQKACEGNVTACLAWLYSRSPERWQDQRSQRHNVRVDVDAEPLKLYCKECNRRLSVQHPDQEAGADE